MPARPLFYLAYAALSVVGFWGVMRNPASEVTGKISEGIFTSAAPTHPSFPSVTLRKRYTGIAAVDSVLAVLVTSFLDGAIGEQRDVQVQQAYFLLSWVGVLVVWSLEAARTRNRGKLISLRVIFGTLSGAFVVPLYCLLFTLTTTSTNYTRQTASVPHDRARALVPAVVFGYILPSLAMYYPYGSSDIRQIAIALWQFSPLLVNVVWAVFRPSSRPVNLRVIYFVGAAFCAVVHLATVYLCVTGWVDWRSIWIPTINKNTPYPQAIKFIFQWDYTIIFVTTTLWAFYEVLRIKKKVHTSVSAGTIGLGMLAGLVPLGPAAVLCVVWAWREGELQGKREE